MKKLFDTVDLGGVKMKNRLVRSATFEMGMADENGKMTDAYYDFYLQLAQGGVGGIITGMMAVCQGSGIAPNMPHIYDDSFVANLKKLVDVVQGQGCQLIVQINHGGVKGLPPKGQAPVGASEMQLAADVCARPLTKDEIANIVEAFANAALRCKQAGASAVQIHAAHGYLLSQFLSPFYNQRQDEYGGGIENRARFLFLVLQAVRAAVGPNYPLWVKVNSADLSQPSITEEECVWLCQQLEKRGINAIEVSAGLGNGRESSPSRRVSSQDEEGYFAPAALSIAAAVGIPVISVGGYRSPEVMEKILNQGGIQALALSRPLIRQPQLPNAWQGGSREKASCTSCSRCFIPSPRFGCNAKE